MNKLAIIGMGASRSEAPFDDDSWTFWGLNNLYRYSSKFVYSAWFEIHKFSVDIDSGRILRKGCNKWRGLAIEQYLMDLQSLNIPVYMQEECQLISNSVAYPKNRVVIKFGRYFTSTHAWMLALAISMGFDTIGLYGVDMIDPEHIDKRPCFEYLLGMAKGSGIEVVIAESSPLLKCDKLYGFEG
jgi:hypothetical protein